MLLPESAYESYPSFLKEVVKRFWQRRSDSYGRIDALALVLASREAWEVALDRAASAISLRTLLAGAAGATTVTWLLRGVLGGPLGLILTGASVASLGALYARHQGRVRARTQAYRRIVTQYRTEFEAIREDCVAGRLRRDQRDLMLEGLFNRMLSQLAADEASPIEPADREQRSSSKWTDLN